MTVKKTLSLKRPSAVSKASAPADENSSASSPAAPTGAATIADRFKLDTPPPVKSGAGTGTKIAVLAAFVALVVAGVLTYTLYGHWEFLKGA